MIQLVLERKERGLSQADLMRRTGLHPSTLCGIEKGRTKPWPGEAERIYDAMVREGYAGEKDELFRVIE